MHQLSLMLREGTRQAHTMAENVGFVKCFLKGTVERSSYRQLLANFYYIYSSLEVALEDWCRHPVLAGLYYPQLYRREAIEQDLRYYYGAEWSAAIAPTAAARHYVERLETIACDCPHLLVAHSYTRYLGDLSGGQILKEIAVRSMGLEGGLGTAFYEFEAVPDARAFKQDYRAALDALPIDQKAAEAITAEAIEAFRYNMRLFEELEGSLIRSIGQMLFNTLTRRRTRAGREVAAASE